ncbi:MAG: AMP-binding protein, partial [Candidatus Promineifilaceae bacterium]
MSQPAGPSTLGECLAAAAADRPAAEALVYGEQRLSWGDYALRVAALARGLLALGLRPAERIAIYLPNCPDYLLAFLAAARIGAITLALNPQYTPREVVHLLGQTGPRLLLTSAELYTPALATALARCCSGLQVILAGAGARGRPGLANVIAAGDALPKHALARRGAAVRPEDGAFIVATGGINGRIKGALLTHANILAAVQAQVSHLDFGADDRLLLHLPLNHVSGALILGAASILSGAAAVIQPQFRPQEALALIARERITLLGQVPTMYSLELAVPDFGRYDLSSLRMCIVAGAPTPAALMARLHTLAPRTVHGYGLSEAAGFATFSLAEDDLPTLSATAGRPLPGVELRTLDPD